jgi:hypothetical protein
VCLGAFSSVQVRVLTALRKISLLACCQEFWCYYNNVEPALDRICKHGKFNLRLFKKNVQPIWEDPANRDGGKWVTLPSVSRRSLKRVVQVIKCPMDSLKLWFDLLLAVIGETLPASDAVVRSLLLVGSLSSRCVLVVFSLAVRLCAGASVAATRAAAVDSARSVLHRPQSFAARRCAC